jgi:YidC/Oxa1 family membrane protein insertase
MPPEVNRIILLIAMMATAYLMILAWQEDYGPKSAMPAGIASESAPVIEDDARTLVGESSTVESDVPQAPAAVSDTGAAAAEAPAATESRLVRLRSDVLDIWIDRRGGDVVRARLPAYPVAVDRPDVPTTLLDQDGARMYVAQSGLIGPDGPDASVEGRPLYTAGSSDVVLADDASEARVTLTFDQQGMTVDKTFVVRRGDYVVEVIHRVRNRRSDPVQVGAYGQLKRDDQLPADMETSALGPMPFLGAAFTTPESRYEKRTFEELEEEPFRARMTAGWAAILQHYFLTAWVPDPQVEQNYFGERIRAGLYRVGFTSPIQSILPGADHEFSTTLFIGPKLQDRLDALAPNLSLTVDYGMLWFIAVPLFRGLELFHSIVGNWGVAIILLTVLVKGLFYPLSAAAYRSMARMRKVAPEMKRIQERFGGDRQKMSEQMMEFYKREKINPLGGCLPMLVQMPVFLALYWVLYESVDLRQAPFILWIDDLATMDPWFVLPIAMGISQYLQMQLNPPAPDPMQQRVMQMMPIVFTVLFLFFPSGLVLYWLVNNVLSMAQQWVITRRIEAAAR